MAQGIIEEEIFIEKEGSSKTDDGVHLNENREENQLTVKEKRIKTLTVYFCYTIHVSIITL